MIEVIAFILVALMAIPATAFPLIYAFRPWWKSLVGRALMTHAVGMALLIDLSLLYKAFGDDYPGRDIVRLTVYVLILVGQYLVTIALLRAPIDPVRKP